MIIEIKKTTKETNNVCPLDSYQNQTNKLNKKIRNAIIVMFFNLSIMVFFKIPEPKSRE